MQFRTLARVAAVAAVAVVGAWQTPVFAAASVSNGKLSCTVTSLLPTLSKTSLTAKATVSCTAPTTASVSIALSEYDGAIEQAIQTPRKVSVAVTKARTNYSVSGSTMTCVNTETGNEEYVSKVQVTLTTSTGALVTSSWDIRLPTNDAHAC